MVTVRQGLTLQEFLALPEQKPALEYTEGSRYGWAICSVCCGCNASRAIAT